MPRSFLAGMLFCCVLCVRVAWADTLLVSGATSLTNTLTEIGTAYTKANPGTTVRFNFGASGALQQQIEQGAPVDIFLPASTKEMDALVTAGRIDRATRVTVTGNRLVLIAPRTSRLTSWEALAQPAIKRVALSDPASVPSGRYAKETLTHRRLWADVEKKSVFGHTVRQTLAYVANGDVDAGIVFATDAEIEKQRVRIVATAVPGKDHAAITYPAAVITGSKNATTANRFLQFLQGTTAQAIFTRYGFQKALPRGVQTPH